MSHFVALCGGVGGAKLAFGLSRVLPPEALTILVNTGDDFEHLGLSISPDIDTVVYTLADLADRDRGWGMRGESWNFMAALGAMGGETWFQLGDRDLAMHVERTRRLRAGETLSQVTRALAQALGIDHPVVPMTDDAVRTLVTTDQGELAFQRYFVEQQCRPAVRGIRFAGASEATPAPQASAALSREDLAGVVICPSNPYLSIDPLLALPGMRTLLERVGAPVIAVSPLVGGKAIKGPTAKLMGELGLVPDVEAIGRHYRDLIGGMVIDNADEDAAPLLEATGLDVLVTQTVMKSDADRVALARASIALLERMRCG